jgi:SAM-dependent methyltransferase
MTSPCPICETDSITVIYAAARDYITGEKFQIHQCNHCSIAYTTPRPNDLSIFYPEKYRRYNLAVLKILEFLYNIRAQNWSRMYKTPGVAFEMGCGDGLMLNTLRKHGWKVFGNERTVAAANFASHTLKLPIYVGEIDSLCLTPTADLIILFQVLEHLKDPLTTLKQLNQFIKPNGKLIIAVPNFGGWQSKFGGEKWFHLDVPRHIFHFSLPSLEFCLRKSGFEIAHVSYVSLEHDPYGWVQSTLNRLDKKHNQLTKLLMGLESPRSTMIAQIILVALFGAISLPLSVASWFFNQGAIMQVVAQKSNV